MLHVVLWKWVQPGFREKYTHDHVNALADAIKKNMVGEKFRIICVTDDPSMINMDVDVYPLWTDHSTTPNISGKHLPSCYRRLRIFDPATQKDMGIAEGDRIMSMDLDTAITGNLVPVVRRNERWVGWAVRGTRHIRVFNGSLFMFTARDFSELWTEFDPKVSPAQALAGGFCGSDQGWLSFKLARRTDCAGWHYPQVLSYPRECSRHQVLPNGSAIVCFHGKRKPWHPDVQRISPWVVKHWRIPDAVQNQQRSA